MRLNLLAAAVVVTLSPSASQVVAQSASGCPVHVVETGDTLSNISRKYFGTHLRAFEIYDRNFSVIGADANIIERGMALEIPCDPVAAAADPIDAQAPEVETTDVEAVEVETPPESTPPVEMVDGDEKAMPITPADEGPKPLAPAEALAQLDALLPPPEPRSGPINALTGGPFSPFVEGEAGGGLFPDLIAAIFSATAGPPVRVGYVDDRRAHLSELMPTGAYALSFPWRDPNCAADVGQPVCQDYFVSSPLYELVTEFYTRADGAFISATTLADVAEARHCRPAGYPVTDLEALGVLDGLMRPDRPLDCLRMLDEGEVDVASLDSLVARSLALSNDIENPILVLEPLGRIDGLVALVPRNRPGSEALIARIEEGLSQIAENGTWFALVDERLTGAPPEG